MALVRIRPGLGREIFAMEGGEPIRLRTILVAALGMGVPVLAGLLLGYRDAGFTIGLGAILLAGAPASAAGAPQEGSHPGRAVLPALLAVAAATAIGGRMWTDAAMILLVAVAGLLSGYSRPLAIAAIRFSIYLVLSVGFLEGAAAYRGFVALIFGLGALWNIVLRMLLTERTSATDEAAPARRTPTAAQRRAHFRKTLRTLDGWQFPLRLALGLGIASGIRHAWPAHHYYWIVLTVALLTQRPIEHVPVKTMQRLIGTIAGVGLAAIILIGFTSTVVLAVLACLLAVMVPVARARSYLLYSVVVTPLILLVLDLGRPVPLALLGDRLVATLAGGIIVIGGNIAFDRLLAASAARADKHGRRARLRGPRPRPSSARPRHPTPDRHSPLSPFHRGFDAACRPGRPAAGRRG
ncbi:MAG TPA: FUSC family protein [Allosphingosinicella sp.]|nr:FUSC family protein [Allosphingosinicella sp.]